MSCGAGWSLIDHQDLISPFGENYGVVTLYYGNGYNCAATTKRVAVGVLTNASVRVPKVRRQVPDQER